MSASSISETRPPRYEVEAPVVSHERRSGAEFEIVFHAPEVARAARPGQFMALLYNDSYAPLIRRPFSIYRVDREAGTCSVLYLARGSFTSGLAQKRPGDVVSLLGPLGRPFRWSADPTTRRLLIAGGIGAPPIYFLADELCRERAEQDGKTGEVIVLNGARTRDLLVGLIEFLALDVVLHALTDDGTHGRQGRVTDLLSILLADAAAAPPTCLYACGPMPMLRAVGEIAVARGLPCQLSVETGMPCGIGTCYGCVIPIRDETAPNGVRYQRACWEGPVFEARDLVW